MKMLTPKQEKFSQLVVSLGNQSEAYRQAYELTNNDAEWIASKASVLCSEVNIRQRIQELREEAKKENKIDRDWIISKHKEIIDWYLELKALAKQEFVSKEDRQRIFMLKDLIKGADFRGSLDSITKMLGLNEAEKIEIKDTSHKTDWGN